VSNLARLYSHANFSVAAASGAAYLLDILATLFLIPERRRAELQ
jgi:hypothetical protein